MPEYAWLLNVQCTPQQPDVQCAGWLLAPVFLNLGHRSAINIVNSDETPLVFTPFQFLSADAWS